MDVGLISTDDHGSDMWELRWIGAHLPHLDEVRTTFAIAEPGLNVDEHDVYVLSGSSQINLKIRHRSNTLKLKTLHGRSSDGLERWRTEFDAALPAGTQLFRDVLDLIGRVGPADRLGAAATAGDAVAILDTICDAGQLVSVYKSRQQFQRDMGTVDVVQFRIAAGHYHSLGVESSGPTELRRLVGDLRLRRLGSPCNYAEFLGVLAAPADH